MKHQIKWLSGLVLGAILVLSSSRGSAEVKGYTAQKVYDKCWNGIWGPGFRCDPNGKDCSITPCGSPCPVMVYTPVYTDGHWHVTGYIQGPLEVDENGISLGTIDVPGFVFADGSTVEIGASDFAGVPALHVDLSGIAVDDAGNWSVVLP